MVGPEDNLAPHIGSAPEPYQPPVAVPGLEVARAEIDDIDARIVDLLKDRWAIVFRIGTVKHDSDAAIRDPGREARILERVDGLCADSLIEPASIRAIFRAILNESRKLQGEQPPPPRDNAPPRWHGW